MAPNGTDTSCTQGTPFRTIQFAIDCASNLDSIFIAPGTYPQSLTIDFSLRLVGAGTGSTIIEPSRGGGGSVVYVSHLYGTDVSISGVTISGGKAQGSGGGIFNDAGYLGRNDLHLVHSVVRGNTSAADGGGIYNEAGSRVYLIGSRVISNHAAEGGGLYNDGGGCFFQDSTIARNRPNDIVGC